MEMLTPYHNKSLRIGLYFINPMMFLERTYRALHSPYNIYIPYSKIYV